MSEKYSPTRPRQSIGRVKNTRRRPKRFPPFWRGVMLTAALLCSVVLAGIAAIAAANALGIEPSGQDNSLPAAAQPDSSQTSALSSAPNSNGQNTDSQTNEKKGVEFNQSFQQSDLWSLVLVNSQVAIPDSFSPQLTNYSNVMLDQRALQAYQQMRDGAAASNITLWISSAYRSQESQEKLFKEQVVKEMKGGLTQNQAEDKACLSVARPAHSEHETGLALDLNGVKENFHQTKEYTWLMENAAEYGFILRFPPEKQEITGVRYEPWHFRYVGIDAAREIAKRQISLEEYLGFAIEH